MGVRYWPKVASRRVSARLSAIVPRRTPILMWVHSIFLEGIRRSQSTQSGCGATGRPQTKICSDPNEMPSRTLELRFRPMKNLLRSLSIRVQSPIFLLHSSLLHDQNKLEKGVNHEEILDSRSCFTAVGRKRNRRCRLSVDGLDLHVE